MELKLKKIKWKRVFEAVKGHPPFEVIAHFRHKGTNYDSVLDTYSIRFGELDYRGKKKIKFEANEMVRKELEKRGLLK